MTRFVVKRLAFLVPQLFAVIACTFVLLRLLPVDPVSRIVGLLATKDSHRIAEHQLGLDRPLITQFWSFLKQLAHFDFGASWTSGDQVRDEIMTRFPVTVQLIVLGFALALAISIPLGQAIAARPGGRAEKTTSIYALFAGAQPDFWWGLIFIYVFYFKLRWFPAPLGLLDPAASPPEGPTKFILLDTLLNGQFALFLDVVKHYALPVITLAFVLTGPILKIMRQSALDVYASDYLLYARASGLPRKVIRRITMRNAVAPVLTVTGILFGFSLGGAVLVETVFSLNGIGRYALQSTLGTDFPAIQGAVVVMTTFALLIYLVMDVLHALLDPRIRYAPR